MIRFGCIPKNGFFRNSIPAAGQIHSCKKFCKSHNKNSIKSIVEELKETLHKLEYEIGQCDTENQQISTKSLINFGMRQNGKQFDNKLIVQMKEEIGHLQLGNKFFTQTLRELQENFVALQNGMNTKDSIEDIDEKVDENHRNEELEQRDRIMQIYNEFNFSAVEETIGYKFVKKAYLIQAFTRGPPSKRLEYLGDSIFLLLIKRFLLDHNKHYSPENITFLHGPLTTNALFAKLAVKYNFHKHLLTNSAIKKFQDKSTKEHANYSKQNDFSNISNFIDSKKEIGEEILYEKYVKRAPKIMANVFEALAAAIYEDSGRDMEIVWRVFYNLMREEIEKYLENPLPVKKFKQKIGDQLKNSGGIQPSFQKKLRQKVGSQAKYTKSRLPNGDWLVTATLDGNLQFTGTGRNYGKAKQMAAERALRHLEQKELETADAIQEDYRNEQQERPLLVREQKACQIESLEKENVNGKGQIAYKEKANNKMRKGIIRCEKMHYKVEGEPYFRQMKIEFCQGKSGRKYIKITQRYENSGGIHFIDFPKILVPEDAYHFLDAMRAISNELHEKPATVLLNEENEPSMICHQLVKGLNCDYNLEIHSCQNQQLDFQLKTLPNAASKRHKPKEFVGPIPVHIFNWLKEKIAEMLDEYNENERK